MPDPKSAEFVTVACKLPHGLILRLFRMVDAAEPIMGGGMRQIKRADPTGEQVHILGNAVAQNAAPHTTMVGGYALTYNVPKDFWDRWLTDNKQSDMVKNGLIFAHVSTASATDESKEKAEIKSGFERLDPNAMPKKFEKATPV